MPAFEATLSRKETIRKGFEMTGIFPFNPEAANRKKLIPGTIFQQQLPADIAPETVTTDLFLDVITDTEIPQDDSQILASRPFDVWRNFHCRG